MEPGCATPWGSAAVTERAELSAEPGHSSTEASSNSTGMREYQRKEKVETRLVRKGGPGRLGQHCRTEPGHGTQQQGGTEWPSTHCFSGGIIARWVGSDKKGAEDLVGIEAILKKINIKGIRRLGWKGKEDKRVWSIVCCWG